MQLKIENLENEMDIRVESLISNIQKYRDEFMQKLKQYKSDLEGLEKFLSIVLSIRLKFFNNRLIKEANICDIQTKEVVEKNG